VWLTIRDLYRCFQTSCSNERDVQVATGGTGALEDRAANAAVSQRVDVQLVIELGLASRSGCRRRREL
jgi:hypothetical protein